MTNALDYCRKHVYFWQSSPIAGKFDESKYKFLVDILLSLDDIYCKDSTIFGPTQSVKTVLLQCVAAYLLDIKRKSMLAVAQSDEDAGEFSKVKLRPFLERIHSLKSTVKKGPYSITDSLWQWASHELIISGPGKNATNSKSACYILTDESHLWNLTNPGASHALRDRTGTRWDRHIFDFTTAPDAGAEVDVSYHKGRQNEWHLGCIYCEKPIWPIWTNDPRNRGDKEDIAYNGTEVFHWTESGSETEMLDSIHMRCPHCDGRIDDTVRNRVDLDVYAQYVAKNPDADRMFNSFRWNCFAPRWKPWRDLFSIYLTAIESAKLGSLEPYSNWVTKHEVRVNNHEYPMLGNSIQGRDYRSADVEVVDENKLRVGSFDLQEGTNGEGFHLWGLIDEFEKSGESKRVCYERLATWHDARKFQLDHTVRDEHIGCDFGARDREVFGYCAAWHWFALKSGDEESFAHPIADTKTGHVTYIELPYSTPRLENPMTGKEVKQVRLRGSRIPPGFCGSRLWSKPRIYPILYAHKNGNARYYGIATDINPEYTNQLHSYIPGLDIDKKTNTTRKTIWKKVKTHDHSFIVSCQNLVIANVAGYFPMSKTEVTI